MISRNDPCYCGSGKKWKKCHYPQLPKKNSDQLKVEYKKKYQIHLKSDEEIKKIRAASKLAANILKKTCEMAKAGVTSNELDAYAAKLTKDAKAVAAALHYGDPPFPKSICISKNEVVCHGIADDKPLVDGDIANIDVAVILDGYYGDCSAMVVIGKTDSERQKVVDVSYDCLMKSIEILKPGVMLSKVGEVIEEHAHKNNCSVVYQFVGHGVGCDFHEAPQVMHCRNNLHIPLAEGMIFTIEPMINAGKAEAEIDLSDGWTAYTVDRKPSAQWEHTILITADGYEILT